MKNNRNGDAALADGALADGALADAGLTGSVLADAELPLVQDILSGVEISQPSAPDGIELDGHAARSHSSARRPQEQKPPEARAPRAAFHSSPTALQDLFLNGLRRENIDVVLYFNDGSQERGVVRAFDTFTLLLENRNSGKAQLIYKHAVIRIFPVRTPSGLVEKKR